MFNLYEILRNAQGGQAIDNLAAQFNITPEEADAAVKAVVPALSEGFLKQASHPVGLGSFIGALGEDQHLAAFTDPAAAQEPATPQAPPRGWGPKSFVDYWGAEEDCRRESGPEWGQGRPAPRHLRAAR
jgi:hypothetical protein